MKNQYVTHLTDIILWCVFRHPNDWPYPTELSHVLLCVGTSAKDVYKILYKQLKSAGVGSGTKTFVYPAWIRELVRERFRTDGKFDEQFDRRQDVYYVTNNDLLEAKWPDIKTDCEFCNSPMPSTP